MQHRETMPDPLKDRITLIARRCGGCFGLLSHVCDCVTCFLSKSKAPACSCGKLGWVSYFHALIQGKAAEGRRGAAGGSQKI